MLSKLMIIASTMISSSFLCKCSSGLIIPNPSWGLECSLMSTHESILTFSYSNSPDPSWTKAYGLKIFSSVNKVVRKHRSAVDMDGMTTMDRDKFYQILLHYLPSGSVNEGKQMKPTTLPFRALLWNAQVHAALFVHRGLSQGLYFLVRKDGRFEELRKSTRPDFDWVKPKGCPANLPLYELATANCEKIAKQLSCHQDIDGDGCLGL